MPHEAAVSGVGMTIDEEGDRGAPVVVLQAREEYLPIFIGLEQARSMQLALDNEPFERPLTHDLFVEVVTEFGGALDKVRIDDLADGTFYAKLDAELYHGGERQKFVFDVRPSDGIALALRVDCPILITDEVLDAAGRPPEDFDIQEFGSGSGPGSGAGSIG